MPPTTRSRPRDASTQTKGSDHNDRATVHVLKGRVKKPYQAPSRVQVAEAMEDGGGHIIIKRPLSMAQQTRNEWNAFRNDDNGKVLRFFTPVQFKTFEGVAWNSRPLDAATLDFTATVGAGLNLPAYQKTFIKDSSVGFRFKNVSQHNTIVEMYICYGNLDTNTLASLSHPIEEYVLANKSYYVGNASTMSVVSLGSNIMSNPKFLEKWRTQRVTFKFEPGEGAYHVLKGPKNYVMDGGKHISLAQAASEETPALWLPPDTKGNGCYVFFRILNDISLISGTTGDTNANIAGTVKGGLAHPVHRPWAAATAFGAVTCEITERYVIGRPEVGVTAVQGVNRNYLQTFQSVTGATIDIQIDADDSSTIPANPS